MSDENKDSINDLINQLQSVQVVRDDKNEDFQLDKENLQDFLLQNSGKLIKSSVDFVEDVKQFITSAPDSRDLEALSKLVGASAAAIETLNKLHLADERNKTAKDIKQMDIDSKKQLQNDEHQNKLLLNREELMKQLINNAEIIEAEISDTTTE